LITHVAERLHHPARAHYRMSPTNIDRGLGHAELGGHILSHRAALNDTLSLSVVLSSLAPITNRDSSPSPDHDLAYSSL